MSVTSSELESTATSGVEERTRAVVDWIQGLLQTGVTAETTLPSLLQQLATVFAVKVAGLAAPLPGPVTVKHVAWADGQHHAEPSYPWQERPEVLKQVKEAPTSLAVQAGDTTHWLLTRVWLPHQLGWLLWVQGDSRRKWTEGEKAALALAGQALARLAASANPQWTQGLEAAWLRGHLEEAASVTARLAHDFGNVLTGILGFAELSLALLPADTLPHRYVKEVCQSAQGGARWIHKLQLFSRRSRPAYWPTMLATVVAREETRVRLAWGNNITFLVSVPADLPTVAIDAESLQQTLAPLLDNAREAISGQGVITLSARAVELSDAEAGAILGLVSSGRYVEVTVTDTGSGMSAEARRRLFAEVFASTKKRQGGLGLPIVYGILQTFGGGLRFGPDPEKGTAISIYFPVAGSGQPSLPVPPSTSPSVGRGTRILVVDDDRMILEFVAKVLEKAGYVVRAVPGPLEALSLFTSPKEQFHLIVSDVVMPQLSGFEMARGMRKHQSHVNFLFISSFLSNSDLAQDELLKEFSLLRKPFEAPELLQAVARALGQSSPVAKGK